MASRDSGSSKAVSLSQFVGVGIAIGVGSELKRTEMSDGASCSMSDCDRDPEQMARRNGGVYPLCASASWNFC